MSLFWILFWVWLVGFVVALLPMVFWARNLGFDVCDLARAQLTGEVRWPDLAEWIVGVVWAMFWFIILPFRLIFRLLG